MKIKGMDKNMRCRGFQFEVGKEYKIDTNGKSLELCTDTVFHYCNSLTQVHKHYSCSSNDNRFFEIEVLGEEITDGNKCGSNHIKIVREIFGEELATLKCQTEGNTGVFNEGADNSGSFNYGNYNSGNVNYGHWNSGSGNHGDSNSGAFNIGKFNSGDFNCGNCNTGIFNYGDFNNGIGNACNNSNGVFCNEEDKNIKIFNQPSDMSLSEFLGSKYYRAIRSVPFVLTQWINYPEEEKACDEEKAKLGGYLYTYTYKEAWRNWWDKMTDENKEIIKQIPNFNAEIFKDITGIEVEK